jgi:hypothetical protein
MKFIKWKFAAYYAANCHKDDSQRQEVESNVLITSEYDDPSVLLGGRAHRFILRIKRKDPLLYESWLQTALMIKKGCPRPSDELVKKSEASTFETLTTEPEMSFVCWPLVEISKVEKWSWADMDDWSKFDIDHDFITRKMFVEEMRRTVKEVVLDKYTPLDRIAPFFPSTSANYINSRLKGGAVGVLLSHHRDELLELRKKYHGPMVAVKRVVPHKVVSQLSSQSLSYTAVSDGKLKNCFAEFYEMIVEKAKAEIPLSEPLGLKEALKIRVISKGPPYLYTALKPLQRFLWSQVQKHPAGRLVGQTVNEDYIQEILGKNLKDEEKYLSVDYQDATNLMAKWVSDELITILVEHLELSSTENEMFRNGLTDHLIQLNQKKFPNTPAARQKRGQLMGSVVSFPLLCLVNMTLLRMAKEIDAGRYLTLKQAGIMVNGDDGSMRCSIRGKLAWEALSSWVGLKPSVGKVYFSKEFLNMNSRTFVRLQEPNMKVIDVPGTCRPSYFREVKFFNLGVFLGLERSSGSGSNASSNLTSLASRAHELVDTLPVSLREKGLAMYIRHHKSELIKVKLPWFLPTHLGGFGLPSLKDVPWSEPNSIDLRMARLYFENPTLFKLPNKPPVTEWRTWQLAQKMAKSHNIDVSELGLQKQQAGVFENCEVLETGALVSGCTAGQVLSLLVVELLFNANLDDLYKEIQPIRRRVNGKIELVDPKEKILEDYLESVRRANMKVVSNKIKPISEVWSYDPHALPAPRPDLSQQPLYPVTHVLPLGNHMYDEQMFNDTLPISLHAAW